MKRRCFIFADTGAEKNCCIAGVNLISNLLLNGFLETVDSRYELAVLAGEMAVLLLEFCLCCYFIRENRKKLFKTLVLTNAVSCLAGFAYFYMETQIK